MWGFGALPITWEINNRDHLPRGSGLDEHAEASARLVEAGVSLVEAGVSLLKISGGADLAGICRPLIHGPDLILRFPEEDAPLPARCVDCANCLLSITKGRVACRPRSGGKA